MSLGKPKFDPRKHHRRSIRLKGYDYSQTGAYYVTIVTYHRDCLFGDIVNGEMILNDLGKIADECWRAIPEHFPFIELGAFVIMPNHMHGIIVINNGHRAETFSSPFLGAMHASPLPTQRPRGPVTRSLGTIVGSFKSAVTNRVGREHNATGIWQRNYYEHIIRDKKDLQNKTDYINANPSFWDEDENNPHNVQKP
ncbi:MAG TPA: transposase [Anaerolineales bacterium]|nr:transposase [Anaerolineales bacterium]